MRSSTASKLGTGFGMFFGLVFVIALIFATVGWALNIIDIFGILDAGFTAELAVRVVGVFVFPLGAVAGYF